MDTPVLRALLIEKLDSLFRRSFTVCVQKDFRHLNPHQTGFSFRFKIEQTILERCINPIIIQIAIIKLVAVCGNVATVMISY